MIRDITLGQYYNTKSIIHSLDPRTKLFITMIYFISLFISNNIFAYILAGFFLLLFIKLSNVPFSFIVKGLKSLLILLIISLVFNLFLTPGKELIKIGFLKITYEGLELSIKMAVRLVYLVLFSSILTLTTTPGKLTDGLEKSLSFLKIFKVPVAEIALMMSISLRFIPILIEETDKIMKAQMSRGASFDEGNIIEKAKSLIPLLVPLFVSAFRRAGDLAIAMESRCFSESEGRTKLNPLKYCKIDYIFYIISIIYIILIFISKWLKI